MERRERLQSARNKDKETNSDSMSAHKPYKKIKSKVASEVKKDKKKKRSNTVNLGKCRRSGGNKTECLKRSRSREKKEKQESPNKYTHKVERYEDDKSMRSTFARTNEERHTTTRASYNINRETREPTYYRVEDLDRSKHMLFI